MILVTGATGFVGSAVTRRLVARGEDVRVLVRPGSDCRNVEDFPVEQVTGDLTDPHSLARALRGCRTLFHVAADYRLWVPRPEPMYAANVEGTCNLMRSALAEGVARIVYTSSVATLGGAGDGRPADEDSTATLAQMIGHYKRSKFLAEAQVRRLVAEAGLPAVIVSPSTPVGPCDVKPTPTGRMIIDGVSGRIPAYVDTGLNLVHVDDVAEGHLLACERGKVGENYILGGENLTLREILQAIASMVGQTPPRLRLPHALVLPVAWMSETIARFSEGKEPRVTLDGVRMSRKYMFFRCEKAKRELGFHPRPAEEALRDAIAWFRVNGYCP